MGDVDQTVEEILRSVKKEPSYLNHWSAYKRIQRLPLEALSDDKSLIRVAVIGSSTLEPLASCLDVKLRIQGYYPVMFVGGFNTYRQEALDKSSPPPFSVIIPMWCSLMEMKFFQALIKSTDPSNHVIEGEG